MKLNIVIFIHSLLKSETRKSEIFRFVITGGTAAALQYGCYLLLLFFCGLPVLLSTLISYIISFIFNYIISCRFTFRTRMNTAKLASFAMSHLINLGLQLLTVYIFSTFINPRYALIYAMSVCVPCNFFIVRFALTSKYFEKN